MSNHYPHVEKAEQYAKDIVSGKIPSCRFVQLACQRQLDDLEKDWKYIFDKDKAENVCWFIENLQHVQSEWSGRPLILEPWQLFIMCTVFGWVDKDTGLRRFSEMYCEIPRKNGKSHMLAGIGLYMMTEDGEPGAEVYAGATGEAQAMKVFEPAWLMVRADKEFRDHYNLEIGGTHKKPTIIYSVKTSSKFLPIIGNPGDGDSPHCAIVDEYHEHKSPDLFNTMKTGQGARRQPLQCVITTAGVDIGGPCYGKRSQVVDILKGTIENDSIFGTIYTLDDKDDWTNFENWKKANPNYGISINERVFKQTFQNTLQNTRDQNINRCKHLNQWMTAGEAFFNMYDYPKCVDKTLKISDFLGEKCWPGVDIASKVDLACMCPVFKRTIDGVDHFYVFLYSYLPEKALEGSDKTHYQAWKIEKWLTVTPGARINIDQIEEDLLELARNHEVVEVPHDPWNAAQFAQHMLDKDIQMVEIQQGVKNFSAPTKELDALIREGRIHFDDNPILKWCISNVVAKYDKNDNVYPYKEKQENKIDGAVALIMGLGRAMVYIDDGEGNDGSGII